MGIQTFRMARASFVRLSAALTSRKDIILQLSGWKHLVGADDLTDASKILACVAAPTEGGLQFWSCMAPPTHPEEQVRRNSNLRA